MPLEIERRFLIKNDNWKEFITKQIFIEQGYLSNSLDDWIIRIRFTGKDFKIALKKHIESFTNFEFEYSIPQKDGETIMSNLSNTIKKERFFLEVEKKSWIIDRFKENYCCEIKKSKSPCKIIKFKKSSNYYNTLIKKLDWKGDLSLKNPKN